MVVVVVVVIVVKPEERVEEERLSPRSRHRAFLPMGCPRDKTVSHMVSS